MIEVKLDFSHSVANEETAQEPATKTRQSNSLIKANTLKNTGLESDFDWPDISLEPETCPSYFDPKWSAVAWTKSESLIEIYCDLKFEACVGCLLCETDCACAVHLLCLMAEIWRGLCIALPPEVLLWPQTKSWNKSQRSRSFRSFETHTWVLSQLRETHWDNNPLLLPESFCWTREEYKAKAKAKT